MKNENNNFIGQKFIAYSLGFFVISFIVLFFFSNKVKASEVPLFEKAIIDSNGFIEINDSNKTKSLIGLGFNSLTTIGSLTADNLLDGWVSNNGFNIIKDLSNLDNGSYSVFPAWSIGEYTEYFWLNGKVGDFVNREIISPHYHKSFSYNTTNVGNLVLFYASTSTGGGDRNYRGLSYWDLYDYQTPLNYTDYPNWTNQEFLAGQITTSDSVENLAFTHSDYISLGANFIEFEFTPNVPPTVFNIQVLNEIDGDVVKLIPDEDFLFHIAYDYCDKKNVIKKARFEFVRDYYANYDKFNSSSSEMPFLKKEYSIPPSQCKGVFSFLLDKEDINFINANEGNPAFVIFYDEYFPDLIDGNDIIYKQEFYPFTYSVFENDNYIRSSSVNGLKVYWKDYAEGEQLKLYFSYNFHDLEWVGSDVCVVDVNSGLNVSCITLDNSFVDIGNAYINVPLLSNKIVNYRFVSSLGIKSLRFQVDFTNAVDLWGEPDVLDPEDNKGLVSGFAKFFGGFFDGMIAPVSKIFPFSYIFILPSAWDLSAPVMNLNGKFGVSINNNGNLYLDLPVGEFEVFGKEFFNRQEKYANFFADVRVFLGYLLAGVFFLIVYRLARKLYDKMTDDNDFVSSDVKPFNQVQVSNGRVKVYGEVVPSKQLQNANKKLSNRTIHLLKN